MQAPQATTLANSEHSQKLKPLTFDTTIFTAFPIGKSYLFFVEKESREKVHECWEHVFAEETALWKFNRLSDYDKPLGETVSMNVNACEEARPHTKALAEVFGSFSARVETNQIEAIFFTTGVAVLITRVSTKQADGENFRKKLQDPQERERVREARMRIIEVCRERYQEVLLKSEGHRRQCGELSWSLYNFKEVDPSGWEPKTSFSYPLYLVDGDTYEKRTAEILEQVAGRRRRHVQSHEARISYEGSEVYVDWSEALVSDGKRHRNLIENNFIIAFASWFALVLMNRHSSFFSFEAFAGMFSERTQPTAEAVHQRNMAYKFVADATLPIRWTSKRRDLFLLETIHRNWSSDRIWQDIEERMKLLTLHYTRLEDERREQFNQKREQFNQKREEFNLKLATLGVILTLVALASAIADVTNLSATYERFPAGFSLIKVLFHISWALIVVIVVAVIALLVVWRRKPRSSDIRATDARG